MLPAGHQSSAKILADGKNTKLEALCNSLNYVISINADQASNVTCVKIMIVPHRAMHVTHSCQKQWSVLQLHSPEQWGWAHR